MVRLEFNDTYFQVTEPPLSTLVGVALQAPLSMEEPLEEEETMVDPDEAILALETAVLSLDPAEDEIFGWTDPELAIIGPFVEDEEAPSSEVVSAATEELLSSSTGKSLPSAFSMAALHAGSSWQSAMAPFTRDFIPSSLNEP
jgi:hypothetical protein